MHKVWVGLITCASSIIDFSTLEVHHMSSYWIMELHLEVEVQDYITSLGITWKFKVALAPWMGGFFESLVGSFKRVLRKVIEKIRLNYVEILTISKEVEIVLNNRPLSSVYYDNPEEPLTPNKLIYGKKYSNS